MVAGRAEDPTNPSICGANGEGIVSALSVVEIVGLAVLEGSLVELPKPDVLAELVKLRSPLWAAALPGSILIGTFAPLWERPFATAFAGVASSAQDDA
jgi:hypothetical protein